MSVPPTAPKAIRSAAAPAPIGPYSQALESGEWLFCSGQIGLDPEAGELVSGGVCVEAQRALESLGRVLFEAGLDFRDVVKTTIYLVDLAEFAVVNEVYAEFVRSRIRRVRRLAWPRCRGAHAWRSRRLRAAARRAFARAPAEPALGSLLDLAAAQAARADEQPPHPAAYLRAHHLEVRLPSTLGTVVGVAHVVAHGAVFATNFTASRHRRPFSVTPTV